MSMRCRSFDCSAPAPLGQVLCADHLAALPFKYGDCVRFRIGARSLVGDIVAKPTGDPDDGVAYAVRVPGYELPYLIHGADLAMHGQPGSR